MGVKSTYDVERKVAISILLEHLQNNEVSNDALGDMLEALPGNTFRNFSVIDGFDNEYLRRIESEEDFRTIDYC